MSYKNRKDQRKILPALINGNIDKYIKVYIKLEIDSLSEDLFETFEYNNLYNISYKDTTNGVLILDGLISDVVATNNIDNLLKEYKVNLIFTASHNVNNNITVPIYADLTYKIFDTYSDFTNNIDATTYDIRQETILIDLKNRGNYITASSDYTPKLLEFIEYYDIYPEYT